MLGDGAVVAAPAAAPAAPGALTEEAAARAIQRAYRYYRVRFHFRDIVKLARARDGASGGGRSLGRGGVAVPASLMRRATPWV
jgi:hypothetical protein